MGWFKNMVKNWLGFEEATGDSILIREPLTFESEVFQYKLWHRGVASELHQFYTQIDDLVGDTSFWSAQSSHGVNFRKIHSGIPALMVDVISGIVANDFQNVEMENNEAQTTWDEIAKENNFESLLKDAISTTLIEGDGAFRVSFNTKVSKYPIIEFFGADEVDYKYNRGRIEAVIFKDNYTMDNKRYVLHETYSVGAISYELYDSDGKAVILENVPDLCELQDVKFSGFMMALPLIFDKSKKVKGRGQSIFESKIGIFDGLDECISQWVDALRDGRVNKYIPEALLPKSASTGEIMSPNSFNNRYVQTESDMQEGARNKIEVTQPEINTTALLETYVTFLDLSLQGIIAPSTLGIDVKKLDNAEAQREKEKATLYTRGKIIDVLNGVIPQLINVTLKAYDASQKKEITDYDVTINFGEYANPSFEAMVETVGKAFSLGIMSTEQVVKELYGDTWDDEQREEEVKLLKEQNNPGIVDEPTLGENIEEPIEGPVVEGFTSSNGV